MSVSCGSLPMLNSRPPAPAADEGALIAKICQSFVPQAEGVKAAEVRLGLGYTAVQLEDGRCGLAYTFRHETGYGCCAFGDAGSLDGRPAAELLAYASRPDPIGAAVALATANALAEIPADDGADGFDLMGMRTDEVAGMVGFFGPLVENVRKRVKELRIFEKTPSLAPGVLPASSEPELLPECKTVIITATALLNRTMDEVLGYCKNAREIMILGASTPYAPELLAAKGVTILSGVRVQDPKRALLVVGQGGGTQRLNPTMRRYSLRIG